MTKGVSRTCRVLISVRVRAINRLQSTELTYITLRLETMQWTHPEMQGDLLPAGRTHPARLVGRKIVISARGENAYPVAVITKGFFTDDSISVRAPQSPTFW